MSRYRVVLNLPVFANKLQLWLIGFRIPAAATLREDQGAFLRISSG